MTSGVTNLITNGFRRNCRLVGSCRITLGPAFEDQTEFCTSNWVFHEAIDDQVYLKKLFETEIGSTIENIIPACYLHIFRKDLPF